MITNPTINVTYLAIAVLLGFGVLCFNLQGGLERVTKYMMLILFVLMIVLAVHSGLLSGAKEGLKFYLVPAISKINGNIIVGAMNQAFFTLSLGIGSMAIFGSYIGKDHSLLSESLNIVLLDTFVAVVSGLIIFPACFTFGVEVIQVRVCCLTPWHPCLTIWQAVVGGAHCSSCLWCLRRFQQCLRCAKI